VTRVLASRLGTIAGDDEESLEVDATLENSPAVLFDAVVVPSAARAVSAWAADGHTLEFIKDQYRHCKTILALGNSTELLQRAGISLRLPSGADDPGIVAGADASSAVRSFIAAIARHRHPERDRDPPLV
jgi:catalase